MKTANAIVLTAVIGAAGFAAWNYFVGPLKDRRDIRELGSRLATCTPYTQFVRRSEGGDDLTHEIGGLVDGRCTVSFQTAGPDRIECALPAEDLAEIGAAYARYAENVGLFGGMTISYNSSESDAWNDALNSSACTFDDL